MIPYILTRQYPVQKEQEHAAPEPVNNVWDELKTRLDSKQYIPERAAGLLSKELTDRAGRHFMLKNGATHSYVRLSPEEFWVWEQMDGEKTVQQLVLAYFTEYQAFAFDAIVSLINRLREGHMLTESPMHLYADLAAGISRVSLSYKLSWVARTVFSKEFVIKKLDRHLDQIHRLGGWVLFTVPIQVLFLLISVIGTVLFIFLAQDPHYALLAGDTVWQLGLLAYIPLVIHEFGHAITAKHMGCEVYKGGLMLYYGVPAAFVDTTDVWFFGKRARLAVTWAGPYTGYIIGGACSVIVYLFPHIPLSRAVMLLQIAFVGILSSTFNILPLLKLDGYYLLADALEIPQLRERSMDFIFHRLRLKFTKHQKWAREEIIFLLFGILAILSTVYFTYAGIVFWDSQASTSISEIFHFHGDLKAVLISIGTVILALSTIYFSVSLAAGGLKKLYHRLQRRGFLSTRWRAAVSLLVLVGGLTFLPPVIFPTLAGWFLLLGAIGAFGLVSWLSLSSYRTMAGSQYAWIWIPLSLAGSFGVVVCLGGFSTPLGWNCPYRRVPPPLGFCSFRTYSPDGSFLTLARSWRGLSLILLLGGGIVLALPSFVNISVEWKPLAGLMMLAGLLHWRMRPTTQIQVDPNSPVGSTREKIMAVYHGMRASILTEVEMDFGIFMRRRVESGAYPGSQEEPGGGGIFQFHCGNDTQ